MVKKKEVIYSKWLLLAEKLDMDCVNLAFSGAGNHFIFQTIMDTIIRITLEMR